LQYKNLPVITISTTVYSLLTHTADWTRATWREQTLQSSKCQLQDSGRECFD